MLLNRLPQELVLMVAEYLETERDFNSLVRTSKESHDILNHHLYRHNSKHHNSSALHWAAEHGNEATTRRCIEEG
ncbi:uncharacterized protein BO97DRAFT_327451, partial [Aspergillus homomorphus CBS 101889]